MKLTKKEQRITGEFGYLYQEMYKQMKEILETKSVDELQEIIKAFSKLTTTNCGWTSYKMKDDVLHNAGCVLTRKTANKELTP